MREKKKETPNLDKKIRYFQNPGNAFFRGMKQNKLLLEKG